MPLAPGLFSMITCWPSTLLALSARARMTMSLEPPAGQGQISLIGRAGKLWAWASTGSSRPAAAVPVVCKNCRRSGCARGIVGLLEVKGPIQKKAPRTHKRANQCSRPPAVTCGTGSVAQHHAFTARVGAAKPARRGALDGLQAAGHLHFAHFMATRLQRTDHLRAKASGFEQGRATQRAEVGQADRLVGVEPALQRAGQQLGGVVDDERP